MIQKVAYTLVSHFLDCALCFLDLKKLNIVNLYSKCYNKVQINIIIYLLKGSNYLVQEIKSTIGKFYLALSFDPSKL